MTLSKIAHTLKNAGFAVEMSANEVTVSLQNRAISIYEVEAALGYKVARARFGRNRYDAVVVR